MSSPSAHTRTDSHHTLKNRVQNTAKGLKCSPRGALPLRALGICATSMERPVPEPSQLGAFLKCPHPSFQPQKKKGDVPVFSHFNMPEPLLTDPLLLEGTGRVEAAR